MTFKLILLFYALFHSLHQVREVLNRTLAVLEHDKPIDKAQLLKNFLHVRPLFNDRIDLHNRSKLTHSKSIIFLEGFQERHLVKIDLLLYSQLDLYRLMVCASRPVFQFLREISKTEPRVFVFALLLEQLIRSYRGQRDRASNLLFTA